MRNPLSPHIHYCKPYSPPKRKKDVIPFLNDNDCSVLTKQLDFAVYKNSASMTTRDKPPFSFHHSIENETLKLNFPSNEKSVIGENSSGNTEPHAIFSKPESDEELSTREYLKSPIPSSPTFVIRNHLTPHLHNRKPYSPKKNKKDILMSFLNDDDFAISTKQSDSLICKNGAPKEMCNKPPSPHCPSENEILNSNLSSNVKSNKEINSSSSSPSKRNGDIRSYLHQEKPEILSSSSANISKSPLRANCGDDDCKIVYSEKASPSADVQVVFSRVKSIGSQAKNTLPKTSKTPLFSNPHSKSLYHKFGNSAGVSAETKPKEKPLVVNLCQESDDSDVEILN